MGEPALTLEHLERRFRSGDTDLAILRDANLSLDRGEVVALVAPSGAGKSTLLHLAGLLERPDAGEIRIEGCAASGLGDRERTVMRRLRIGFVYQAHHLLAEFTALENVMLPQLAAGVRKPNAVSRAQELLTTFGLAARASHLPGKLSGGEQQRIAVARALANRPAILLADEPTGNLDEATSATVFAELLRITRDQGVAALVATHNGDLARRMDRILRLTDGSVVDG